MDFQDFLKQLEYYSQTASKWKLESARSVMVKAYAQRFKRRKEPRYGSINKGFTEPELQRFFRSIASEKLASFTLLRKSLKTNPEPAFSAFLLDVLPLVLNPEP